MSRLLEISAYAAALVVAIALFRRLLQRRLSPALQYGLWFLLVLRLLLPFTLESGVHFITLPAEGGAAAVVLADDNNADAPPLSFGSQGVAATVPENGGGAGNHAGMGADAAPAPAVRTLEIRAVIAVLWTAGMAIQAAYYGIGFLKMRRIKQAALAPPKQAQALLDGCMREVGLKGTIGLLLSDEIRSPALLPGKCILLPVSLLADEAMLRHALLHELTHIRRRDHLMSGLLHVLQCIYWFHPLVRFGFREMRLDMETACDAEATAMMCPAQKKEYYMLLIDLFCEEPAPSLGMALGTQRMARRRIAGAAMCKKTRCGTRLAALTLSALLLICCFTTACQPAAHTKVELEPAGGETQAANSIAPVAPTPTATEAPETVPALGIQPLSSEGDKGDSEWQAMITRLESLGYPITAEDTGYPYVAVRLFQQQNGLRMDGIYGEETQAMLFSENAQPYGAQAAAERYITALQQNLQLLGYLDKATGIFDEEMAAAVRAFQAEHGFEVDGVVGSATYRGIQDAVAAAGYVEHSAQVQALIDMAASTLGTRYIQNGKSRDGMDAAGLVYYCLNAIGISAPYMTPVQWQAAEYPTIEHMEDMEAGDIICFEKHVAIYMGDDVMINASSMQGEVCYRLNISSSAYWTAHFVCAKRVLP